MLPDTDSCSLPSPGRYCVCSEAVCMFNLAQIRGNLAEKKEKNPKLVELLVECIRHCYLME